MTSNYKSRASRMGASKSRGRSGAMTQSTPGGSYDGKPAEDDPRWNPKRNGNKRSGKRDPYKGRKRPAFNQYHWQNT